MALKLSIIIPAYNEEKYLSACLAATKQAIVACDRPTDTEIIVVDNASTDLTTEIALEAGAIVVGESEHKISKVRNAGARAATGEYLLFIDADTVIAESAIQEVVQVLGKGDCLGGGCYVKYDIGGMVAVAAWFINHMVARVGRAWGTFLFCQRAAFEEIGGFDETLYGMEELVFSEALKKSAKAQGLGFRVIPKYLAVTSGRRINNQLREITKRLYLLFNLRENMQDPDVCHPVWYDEDR